MPNLEDITIPEMQSVKEKYPQYKDTNDVTLLNNIVRKYPVYKPIASRVGGEIIAGLKDGTYRASDTDVQPNSPISTATRWLMGSSGLEKFKTESYRYGLYQKYPQGQDETNPDYEKRVGNLIDQRMQDRENDIIKGGTLPQLDDVMTLGVGTSLMKAPVLTAKILGMFAALEGGAQVTGVNKAIDNIQNPTMKDSAQIAKTALFGALSGGFAIGKPGEVPLKPSDHITDNNIHPDVLSHALSSIDEIAADKPPQQVLEAKKVLLSTVSKATGQPVADIIKSVGVKPLMVKPINPETPVSSNIETTAKPGAVQTAKPTAEKQPDGQTGQPTAGGTPVVGTDKAVPLTGAQRLEAIKQRANAPYNVTVNLPDGSQKVIPMPLAKLMDLKDSIKSGDSKIEIVNAVKQQATPPPTKVAIAPDGNVASVKPTDVKVQPNINPKPSGLAQSVEANAVASKLTSGFKGISDYDSINIPEVSKASTMLVNRDKDLGYRIAMGHEEPPQGIPKFAVYTAVEAKAIADGDVNTLRDLATRSSLNKESSGAAQTLRLLAERDPNSPVTVIKDIKAVREKAVLNKVKDYGLEKSNVMADIKNTMTKVKPAKETWTSFVESIKC